MPATKSVANWKKAKQHLVTLPSGFEAVVEIPNIPLLVKTGQLPNDLVTEAIGNIAKGKLTKEIIEQQSDFYDKVVILAVKDPVLTEADVHDIPFEDVEMIVEIATRQRDLDAAGHHVGGLNENEDWRTFRGLAPLNSNVEGL